MGRRGGGGGLTIPVLLSREMSMFMEAPKAARTEVVRKLWAHIKANKLQDPANKRNINCDAMLHTLLGVRQVDMFQMHRLLNIHFYRRDRGWEPVQVIEEEEPPPAPAPTPAPEPVPVPELIVDELIVDEEMPDGSYWVLRCSNR